MNKGLICLFLNLMTPGTGTLVAGEKSKGFWQYGLWISGFFLFIIGVITSYFIIGLLILPFAIKTMGSIFGSPFKFVWQIFKRRGGYRGHLSRSSNPFQALNENMGLLYTGSMWRLDNVAKFTKISAEATRDLKFQNNTLKERIVELEDKEDK